MQCTAGKLLSLLSFSSDSKVPLTVFQRMLHSSRDHEVSKVPGALGECEYWNIQTTKIESIGIPGTRVFRWPWFICPPRHGS